MKLQPDGAGGFRGLFLPAGATVSVHNFRISFWGEPSSSLAIKVVLADEIKFMRNPIERMLGKKLLSAKNADVKELRRVESVPTPDMGEFPLTIKKSGEVMVPDAMAQKCAAQGP
jgi:hypothetical protein